MGDMLFIIYLYNKLQGILKGLKTSDATLVN